MARQTILSRTEAAIKGMPWLEPSDEGVKRLVLTHARLLDAAITDYETGSITTAEFHKMLRLGPDLLAGLSALGGTPATRKAIQGEVQQAVSDIDELKAKRAARAARAASRG